MGTAPVEVDLKELRRQVARTGIILERGELPLLLVPCQPLVVPFAHQDRHGRAGRRRQDVDTIRFLLPRGDGVSEHLAILGQAVVEDIRKDALATVGQTADDEVAPVRSLWRAAASCGRSRSCSQWCRPVGLLFGRSGFLFR